MKGRRFTKRDRRTPGLATGSVVCEIAFPSVDETYQLRPLGKSAIEKARKFISKHIADRVAVLHGATFTICAEVRANHGGLRRVVLAKWTHGDDLEKAFETAVTSWTTLTFEGDYVSYESEIDVD